MHAMQGLQHCISNTLNRKDWHIWCWAHALQENALLRKAQVESAHAAQRVRQAHQLHQVGNGRQLAAAACINSRLCSRKHVHCVQEHAAWAPGTCPPADVHALQKGNRAYEAQQYKQAYKHWTEALQMKVEDAAMNAVLYCNRWGWLPSLHPR